MAHYALYFTGVAFILAGLWMVGLPAIVFGFILHIMDKNIEELDEQRHAAGLEDGAVEYADGCLIAVISLVIAAAGFFVLLGG